MQYPKSKSFSKGLKEVPFGKFRECKARLKEAIGITSEPIWRKWRDGTYEQEIPREIAANIQSVFIDYGVKDPWGA